MGTPSSPQQWDGHSLLPSTMGWALPPPPTMGWALPPPPTMGWALPLPLNNGMGTPPLYNGIGTPSSLTMGWALPPPLNSGMGTPSSPQQWDGAGLTTLSSLPSAMGCPTLIAPQFGDVKVTGTAPGSVATYSCREGYKVVSGVTTRTCGNDGNWGGDAITCKGVVCV